MASAEEHGLKPRSTIREVASAAGVSIATVSRVLNGRPDVAPSTRARVEQLLDQHKYLCNGLRAQRRSLLFHSRNCVGDSLSRITGDSWCVYKVVDALLFTPGYALVMLVGMVVLLANLDLG